MLKWSDVMTKWIDVVTKESDIVTKESDIMITRRFNTWHATTRQEQNTSVVFLKHFVYIRYE